MSRHARVEDDKPVIVNAGAMHKYAAPRVHARLASEVHGRSLELQAAAAVLDVRHSREFRRARRVERLRRTAWLLVVLAAVLLAVAVVPDQWWGSVRG